MIADYAEEKSNMSTAIHYCGSPIDYMACIHTASVIRDFVALENHSLDIPWWKDLVTGLPDALARALAVDVPEKPGLGIDLNPEVIKEHLLYPGYFEPTPEWDLPHL